MASFGGGGRRVVVDVQRVDGGEQLLGVGRLDEVTAEARFLGASAILFLTVPGHRHQAHAVAPSGALGQLVAVHDRQADVEDSDLRPERVGQSSASGPSWATRTS